MLVVGVCGVVVVFGVVFVFGVVVGVVGVCCATVVGVCGALSSPPPRADDRDDDHEPIAPSPATSAISRRRRIVSASA